MNRKVSCRAPRTLSAFAIGILLVVACVLALPTYARAATWTVGAEPGMDYVTVQAAIDAAAPGDTVLVALGDYNESIVLTKSVTLAGAGRDLTTLTGAGSSVIRIDGTDSATISGFTITGGRGYSDGAVARGGGIYCSEASPTITDCTITGNTASVGGGVYIHGGAPTITNCDFTYNSSRSDYEMVGVGRGGGIYCDTSTPTITNCTISGNGAYDATGTSLRGSGGGIYSYLSLPMINTCTFSKNCAMSGAGAVLDGSTPTVTACTFSENDAADYGGGLYIKANTAGSVADSTIVRNYAAFGGGMYCAGSPTLVIGGCTLADNDGVYGGGAYFVGAASPTVHGSTVTGNEADCGAGIYFSDSLAAITACNIAENHATSLGGGIFCSGGSPTITSCTISGNGAESDGGGIYLKVSRSVITNCIISANHASNGVGGSIYNEWGLPTITNCTIVGGLASLAGGIFSNIRIAPTITNCIVWDNQDADIDGCLAIYSDVGTGDASNPVHSHNVSADPQFVDAVAGDYRLAAVSPCVDTGSNTSVTVPESAKDKLGIPRPQGAAFDMGAYELQKDLYVEVDGDNTDGLGTIDKPYKTIPYAIDKALFGATVHVGPGDYWGSLDGDVHMKDGVSLIGAGSSATTLWGWASTISAKGISSETTISGFTIAGGHASYGGGINLLLSSPAITDCVISGNWAHYDGGGINCDRSSPRITGCTISGNESEDDDGGGVNCVGSEATFTDCDIIDNWSDDDGGGIYGYDSTLVLAGCTISGNDATDESDGGGIYCGDSSSTITSCTISGNYAEDDGGGMGLYGGSQTIINCVIADNEADDGEGGAIDCYDCSPVITNCTITGNTASYYWDSGDGIYGDGASPIITNCIVWGNGGDLSYCSASYSDIGSGDYGEGGFSADPQFVSPETGDYRLASGSPCIDAGNPAVAPAFDKDGVARPQPAGGLPDMGAYESSQRTLTYTAGPGGSVVGASPQSVVCGGSGSPVQAVPDPGHRFERWADTGSAAPDRTDTNVQTSINAYAVFVENDYTLTYTAGPGGSVTGPSPQTVRYDDNGVGVKAVPAAGFHFVKWSDTGSTDAQRIDFHVSADIAATAIFASDAAPLTLTYTAGPGGSILGASPQSVPYKGSGTEVVAKPASGYHFLKWSDNNSTDPKRTDTDVQDHINATALFAKDFLTLSYTTTTGGSIVGSEMCIRDRAAMSALTWKSMRWASVEPVSDHFTKW